MPRYVVGYCYYGSRDLLLEFVEADNELAAIKQHSEVVRGFRPPDDRRGGLELAYAAGGLDAVKYEFFDWDVTIDVKEVPQN